MTDSKFETTKSELSDAEKLRRIAERIMGWEWRPDYGGYWMTGGNSTRSGDDWNPLENNDDAAELRRRLWEMGYRISGTTGFKTAIVTVYRTAGDEYAKSCEITNSDPIAAERRALVEAAAEVAERLAGPRHHHPDLDDSVSY